MKGKGIALHLYNISQYFRALLIVPYLQHWSLCYLSHQTNPHSFLVSFCHRTNCSQFSGLKSPPFLLRSQFPSINQWPAGRWAGDQAILGGLLHMSAGWQLSAWVAHSPQGGLSSPSRLSGSPSCWSWLQGHQERLVHDIQVSSCVMCANVLLAKASHLAKLSVWGNYQGIPAIVTAIFC